MRKFNFRLLASLLALTLFSAYTKDAVTSRTSIKRIINSTAISDALIPTCQHGNGRNPANRGGGGRDGRQAPAAASRGPPPPGSPIASRILIQHNIPATDNLLDTFL